MAGFRLAALIVAAIGMVSLVVVLVLDHAPASLSIASVSSIKQKPPPKECKLLPAIPRDRRPNKSRLRVITMNAEWLYLHGGSGGLRCPGSRCTWNTNAEARGHLKRVQQVLRNLNGDIVNIVEVEDCRVLGELGKGANRFGVNRFGYKPYLVKSTDRALGQNVGMLTRIDPIKFWRSPLTHPHPIKNSTCPRSPSGRTSLSKHYLSRIMISPHLTITIIAVHLIAMPEMAARCSKREAQAAILQQLIRKVDPRDEIIVLGDFNDYDHDVDNNASARRLYTPVMRMIKNADPNRPLMNAAHKLAPHKRWTSWWDKNQNCRMDGPHERTMIDHVLVSRRLYKMIEQVFIPHHLYEATCRVDKRVSDHWPVVIDIKI